MREQNELLHQELNGVTKITTTNENHTKKQEKLIQLKNQMY